MPDCTNELPKTLNVFSGFSRSRYIGRLRLMLRAFINTIRTERRQSQSVRRVVKFYARSAKATLTSVTLLEPSCRKPRPRASQRIRNLSILSSQNSRVPHLYTRHCIATNLPLPDPHTHSW